MTLIEAIKKAETSLIEGESKIGKLTFSLFALSKLNAKKPLIVSAINKAIIQKRLNNLKTIKNPLLEELLNKIKLYALKSNWEQLKYAYGFDIFLEDFTKLIKDKKPDALILHRSDLMFSEIEFEYAKIFIENLIDLKNQFNFRLFLTTAPNSFISEFSENYTDITYLIEKDNIARKVIVKNSIFPLEHYEYYFYLKSFSLKKIEENRSTSLSPTKSSSSKIPINIKLKPKMLVISTDEYFIKLHQYLFEKHFDLSFAKTIGEVISKIMQNPDIIIYQTEETEPDKTVCTLVKENKLNSKIIYFINKEFIRTEDKMEISFLGCYEIIPKIFNLEEYIFILERAVNNFFYTSLIHKLPPFINIKTLKHFYEIVENLYKERIYFSIIKTRDKIENVKNKLRIHDAVYQAKDYLCIILIDVTKIFFENKLKNKFNLKDYKIIEAIELEKKKDFCK